MFRLVLDKIFSIQNGLFNGFSVSRDEEILGKLVENLHEPNRHWRNGLLKLYIHNDTEIVTEYELQLSNTPKYGSWAIWKAETKRK